MRLAPEVAGRDDIDGRFAIAPTPNRTPMPDAEPSNPEQKRLADDAARTANWKRWGPYLAERQWSTVREDYSADGDSWNFFPHDHARTRAYRWGEDGLLGITDRECRLCFAPGALERPRSDP